MGTEETCSALCVMSDPDKVVFARSEKFGNATHVIVWDLLGNQALKEVKYDAPVGNNDYVNFLKLSHNDRYCVLGFNNSFDNHAEFVVFDMNQTQHEVTDPCLLRLDANTDCTVILPRDEAVTGLRNGDLVVWSLRTGQPSRQLLSGTGVHAHNKEVKAVVLSEDNRYLVSASADGTLKVWDMQTERQLSTLRGHKDEVRQRDLHNLEHLGDGPFLRLYLNSLYVFFFFGLAYPSLTFWFCILEYYIYFIQMDIRSRND